MKEEAKYTAGSIMVSNSSFDRLNVASLFRNESMKPSGSVPSLSQPPTVSYSRSSASPSLVGGAFAMVMALNKHCSPNENKQKFPAQCFSITAPRCSLCYRSVFLFHCLAVFTDGGSCGLQEVLLPREMRQGASILDVVPLPLIAKVRLPRVSGRGVAHPIQQ